MFTATEREQRPAAGAKGLDDAEVSAREAELAKESEMDAEEVMEALKGTVRTCNLLPLSHRGPFRALSQ